MPNYELRLKLRTIRDSISVSRVIVPATLPHIPLRHGLLETRSVSCEIFQSNGQNSVVKRQLDPSF